MTDDPPTPDNDNPRPNPQDSSSQQWQSGWLVGAAALGFLVTFSVGLVIGALVIGSSGSNNAGAADNALACSYFWQFETAPNMPMLVQAALRNNPGDGPGSLFLGEWLNTFYQQVNSPTTTMPQLLSDSKNGTALGISSICQQLGYSPPGS
jgi:hypothetical protein